MLFFAEGGELLDCVETFAETNFAVIICQFDRVYKFVALAVYLRPIKFKIAIRCHKDIFELSLIYHLSQLNPIYPRLFVNLVPIHSLLTQNSIHILKIINILLHLNQVSKLGRTIFSIRVEYIIRRV